MANIDKATVQGGKPSLIRAGVRGVIGCVSDIFVINSRQTTESFRESIHVVSKLADGVQSDAARVKMAKSIESMHRVHAEASRAALWQTLASTAFAVVVGVAGIAVAAQRSPAEPPGSPPKRR